MPNVKRNATLPRDKVGKHSPKLPRATKQMAKTNTPAAPAHTPAVELDLDTASTRAFSDAIDRFYTWSENQSEPGPLDIESGWHTVDWVTAEDYLRRNICNREPTLNHVKKLLYDMERRNWRRTGQGLIFNNQGKLNEGQQRLLASYFGQVSFDTYIVTDAPSDDPDLFTYYDDNRPRSAADALQTSGLDGIASHLATAVHLSDRYDRDALGILKQPKIHKLTSREVLAYSRDNPALAETGHMIFSNHPKAVSVIKNRGVAITFAERVTRHFGPEILDAFMTSLGSGAHLAEDDPILGLRTRLLRGEEDNINKERVLALLIKGFNYYRAGKKLTRAGLFVKDNERFPKLEPAFSTEPGE